MLILLSTIILFVLFIVFLLVIDKFANKNVLLILVSTEIAVLLIMAVGLVFALSEYFFNMYSIEPYSLSYKDVLTSITQIVSFIGATSVGAIGIFATFIKNKK